MQTMTITRRNTFAVLGSLVCNVALAAGYPDRTVRLIVALAPGGPADTAARVFAPYFSSALGQSVFVENRTGASSVVGTEAVVHADPDGYTLLFGSSSSLAVNPAVIKNLRFDVQKDLRLVGLVSFTPHVLVVRASLSVKTLDDLIRLAKENPGKLTYGSSGTGGAIHLATELFKAQTGVNIVHVPYRGGGPAMVGLLGGDVDVFFSDLSTTRSYIGDGKVNALAMAWPTRSPLLPDVPTFAELGYPGVVSSSWFGLAAPAQTPSDVVDRLARALQETFKSPDYQAALAKIGDEQFTLTPEESSAFIQAEMKKWAEVARFANIEIE